MKAKRDYIAEAHELNPSVPLTGSIRDMTYEAQRNLYRRTAYAAAVEAGLGTREANLLRRGTYSGNKLTSAEEFYNGRKRTYVLKDEIAQANNITEKTLAKWNRRNEQAYQRHVAAYNKATPETQAKMQPPKEAPAQLTEAEFRQIMGKRLDDEQMTLDDYEDKIKGTP